MKTALSLLILVMLSLSACGKAAKQYPDPFPGWHSNEYTTVFGRLQRVPSTEKDAPPIWIIRYGLGSETYGGTFALTPADTLVGYSGGEQVEIKGSIRREGGLPGYGGTWYNVQSIKMWNNYR